MRVANSLAHARHDRRPKSSAVGGGQNKTNRPRPGQEFHRVYYPLLLLTVPSPYQTNDANMPNTIDLLPRCWPTSWAPKAFVTGSRADGMESLLKTWIELAPNVIMMMISSPTQRNVGNGRPQWSRSMQALLPKSFPLCFICEKFKASSPFGGQTSIYTSFGIARCTQYFKIILEIKPSYQN